MSILIIRVLIFLLTRGDVSFLLPVKEFWLEPEKFICQRGETINIRFRTGKNFKGDNWTGDTSRIKTLRLFLADVTDDLTDQLTEQKGDSLQIAMFDEGTAMIAYNSEDSLIELEASRFNDYLKENDLQNAISYRERNEQTEDAAKQLYQRSVKTLVQVGDKTNDVVTKETGLPLDIIPVVNPYTLKNNDQLTVRVLFHHKILANSRITIWHGLAKRTVVTHLHTNDKGEIRIKVPRDGKWMVSAVKINRLEKDVRAGWRSFWGSLTWGY